MASRQEEPATEYEEEYESESDKGLVAFFETISVWIIGIITVIILAGMLRLVIGFIIGSMNNFGI